MHYALLHQLKVQSLSFSLRWTHFRCFQDSCGIWYFWLLLINGIFWVISCQEIPGHPTQHIFLDRSGHPITWHANMKWETCNLSMSCFVWTIISLLCCSVCTTGHSLAIQGWVFITIDQGVTPCIDAWMHEKNWNLQWLWVKPVPFQWLRFDQPW